MRGDPALPREIHRMKTLAIIAVTFITGCASAILLIWAMPYAQIPACGDLALPRTVLKASTFTYNAAGRVASMQCTYAPAPVPPQEEKPKKGKIHG